MAAAGTPKDTGWSWVVLAASSLVTTLVGFVYTSGVFFIIFLETFQTKRSTTAWVVSIQGALALLIGPIVSIMNTRLGERCMVVVGGLTVAFGFFTSYFARGMTHLFLTFGIITGIGIGMVYLPASVIVGFYFERYRNVAYGVVTMASGIGTLILNPLIQYFIDNFGWRGTMWLCAGISLHFCISGALLRPPVTGSKTNNKQSRESKTKPFSRVFDVSLLTNITFDLFCVSIILNLTGVSVAFVHVPAFARLHGATHAQSAFLMSIYGAGSIAGRFLTGVLISFPRVNMIMVNIVSCLVTALSAFLYLSVGKTYGGQILCTTLVAFFGNVFNTLTAPLIIKVVGLARLPDGLSIAVFSMGIGCVVGPPAAGWLFDLTGEYQYSFYFSAICCAMAALVMLPAVFVKRCQRQVRMKTQYGAAKEIALEPLNVKIPS